MGEQITDVGLRRQEQGWEVIILPTGGCHPRGSIADQQTRRRGYPDQGNQGSL